MGGLAAEAAALQVTVWERMNSLLHLSIQYPGFTGRAVERRCAEVFLGEDAVELPEDSYHGDDIIERAKEFASVYGDSYLEKSEEERRRALTEFALPKNIETMKKAMEKYRIAYDLWFSEKSAISTQVHSPSFLHDGGSAFLNNVDDIIQRSLSGEIPGGFFLDDHQCGWIR